ncbi:MAG: hypothetical protein PHP52_03590 [Bacteroidales bacterium]|nr:hypothetical protein [Bacteroidales bacterium]MDD4216535.1 hypothetical protein [Bacteroidales bacterium]MDY0141445.1 hypothetical protein [Bacteroidales bacterium]
MFDNLLFYNPLEWEDTKTINIPNNGNNHIVNKAISLSRKLECFLKMYIDITIFKTNKTQNAIVITVFGKIISILVNLFN